MASLKLYLKMSGNSIKKKSYFKNTYNKATNVTQVLTFLTALLIQNEGKCSVMQNRQANFKGLRPTTKFILH